MYKRVCELVNDFGSLDGLGWLKKNVVNPDPEVLYYHKQPSSSIIQVYVYADGGFQCIGYSTIILINFIQYEDFREGVTGVKNFYPALSSVKRVCKLKRDFVSFSTFYKLFEEIRGGTVVQL